MYSIICCSVNPEAAIRMEKNIAETIGVPFEFIAFDNREHNYGICKVYNLCAARARYDLLCFVHEDVNFITQNWGGVIAGKLQEPDCGVVGFAGGTFKLAVTSSWYIFDSDARHNFSQPSARGGLKRYHTNPEGIDFAPAVCLDGLCLMVRKQVWEQTPFDETLLTGFHAYDMDFTTAVACGYTNYVCNNVDIIHFSRGSFSREWLHALKLYHDKWRHRLPLFCGEPPSQKALANLNRRAEAHFMKTLFKKQLCSRHEALGILKEYIARYPRHGLSWLMAEKYIEYMAFKRKPCK